jgi:hypothetical protein
LEGVLSPVRNQLFHLPEYLWNDLFIVKELSISDLEADSTCAQIQTVVPFEDIGAKEL